MFLEHGLPRAVRLPDGAFAATGSGCTTVAILAPRSMDFVVRIDPVLTPKHHATGGRAERSTAGAVTVSECGASRAGLARLSVELRAARAVLETVVATGEQAAGSIADALPERASGPVAPLADAGPRMVTEPVQNRVRRAEQRSHALGATVVKAQMFTAEVDGTGREVVRLDEGCHRIDLFAENLPKHPMDLDSEIREAATERLLARDRSDAPDARLELCAGASMGADLVFAGAPGPVHVTMLDAVFALPHAAPTTWGARARAGIAGAWLRHRVGPIDTEPVEQRLGVAGLTSFPLWIEPGACYVAALGIMRGEPRLIALTAKVDTRIAFDSSAGIAEGSSVAFCSEESDAALFDVEVRGGAASWVLALYQLGSRPLGTGP
jgi:hypothetical protein